MAFLAPVLLGVAKVAAPLVISGTLQKKAAEKQGAQQIAAQERIAQSQLVAEVELEKRRIALQERQLEFQQQEAAKAAKAAEDAQARREQLAALAPTTQLPPVQGGAVAQSAPPADNTGLLLALLMQSRQTETPAPPPEPKVIPIQPNPVMTYLPAILAGGALLLAFATSKR